MAIPSDTAPAFASYDLIVVSTSGGKDSQTQLRKVCQMAAEAGVLDRVVAVHYDLGRVEWQGTRELAEEQVRHYGVRFEVVRREQGDLLDHVEKYGKFPTATTRFCTSDHKRGPLYKLFTKLTAEVRARVGDRQVRILNAIGLRAEESPARAKKEPFFHDAKASNGRRSVDVWLPIHDWSAQRVWEDIRASGVRHHYAYDLGMPRLSCAFCVIASRDALLLAGEHNPGLLQEYVNVEKRIGHTLQHVNLVKLGRGQKTGISAQMIQEQLAAGVRANPAKIQSWCM